MYQVSVKSVVPLATSHSSMTQMDPTKYAGDPVRKEPSLLSVELSTIIVRLFPTTILGANCAFLD